MANMLAAQNARKDSCVTKTFPMRETTLPSMSNSLSSSSSISLQGRTFFSDGSHVVLRNASVLPETAAKHPNATSAKPPMLAAPRHVAQINRNNALAPAVLAAKPIPVADATDAGEYDVAYINTSAITGAYTLAADPTSIALDAELPPTRLVLASPIFSILSMIILNSSNAPALNVTVVATDFESLASANASGNSSANTIHTMHPAANPNENGNTG
mmetsp:Transcript_4103/g.14982  ORF Transcript_4103/g.14982 Transcript_4103/m.14982 type:complete len:216 (-) Transcript_4103:651-1298(-)